MKQGGFFRQAAEQGGLFGSELETDSLLGERAKIINNLARALQNDATLFKTLEANAGKIEATGGNKLDREGNQATATQASIARERVQRMAFTDPELKSKLDQAARDYKNNPGKLASIIQGLKEAIRADVGHQQGKRASSAASSQGSGASGQGRPGQGQRARPSGTRPDEGASTGDAGAQGGQVEKVYNSRLPALGRAGLLSKETENAEQLHNIATAGRM